MSEPVPARALVIMSHPDEVEFFVGGTVAMWTDAGAEIAYLLLTSGDKGSQDPEMTPKRLVAIREEEQRAAAAVLGVNQMTFLREPDGDLAPTMDLRKRVVAELRRFRPDAVIFPDPTGYFHHPYESHPDLRVAGQIVLDAVVMAARNRMFHAELLAEGLEPHICHDLWLASAPEPNRWVDITPAMDRKVAALCCHQTQVPDAQALDARLRSLASAVDEYGRTVYREGFRYMRID